MPKSYSQDLRARVIEAVTSGASRREAAELFDVATSTAVKWMQRLLKTGSFGRQAAWRQHVASGGARGGDFGAA